jgi:hypothetical protein
VVRAMTEDCCIIEGSPFLNAAPKALMICE